MKVIYTRFHGPTNTRPSRISAWTDDKQRLTMTMGQLEAYDTKVYKDDCHQKVAEALRDKYGWQGRLIGSQVKRGWVFVFDPITDKLLNDAALEIWEMHQYYLSRCNGGCPALDIINRIEDLTGKELVPERRRLGQLITEKIRPYSKTIAIHDAMEGN